MALINSRSLSVTGSRFRAVYHIRGDAQTAKMRAEDICIEETIEYPPELIPEGGIREHVFGRVEAFDQLATGEFRAVISYADEITGFELPQLLNVLFGNISMKPGIRLVAVDLSASLLAHFRGPRFGIRGLREILGIARRPLLCTATKPMGLAPAELAALAYQLALGGVDIIKDDHGLANQPFAPFTERVLRTCEAIQNANARTGGNTIYLPNVTGPLEIMLERIQFSRAAGAGGIMLIPGYCGVDFMRRVADDDSISLPIMSHPAFIGSYVLSAEFGISHRVLHGSLMRLAGADLTIFPNYVGRFSSYTRHDCREIAEGCTESMGNFPAIFPAPGGGISKDAFADMIQVYGRDVAFLMSSNLHRNSPDLATTVRSYRETLERISEYTHRH